MGSKATYTNRKLTDEERAFAETHHDLMYRYMRIHELKLEDWYDILIIPYLQSVKKYFEYEKLQKLKFEQVFFRTLDSARSSYWRAVNRKKRCPKGGLFSYDNLLEGEDGSTFEKNLIDIDTNVEKQVILKELYNEFYNKCVYCESDAWGDDHINEYLKCELDLLLEGHTHKQVNKKTEKVFPYGYDLDDLEDDIADFRKIFKEVFGI